MEDKIKTNEWMDMQSLVVNMYKEGYLDGYLHAINKAAGQEVFDKKATWQAIKDESYKSFQKFIKFKELKGGKEKK